MRRVHTCIAALIICLVPSVAISQAAPATGAPGTEVGGPTPAAPVISTHTVKKGDKPFTDDCGNIVEVEEGKVRVTLSKVDGKTCITMVSVGEGDDATITAGPDSKMTVKVEDTAKVTIMGSNLGTKKLVGDPEMPDLKKSVPGVTISGDGEGKSKVTIIGNENVVKYKGASTEGHTTTITGLKNWIVGDGGSGTTTTVKTTVNGQGNIIFY